MPPRRTASMAVYSAASRSMPAFFIIGSAIMSGSIPANFCTPWATGEPCASMPTASMTESGAAAVGELADDAADTAELRPPRRG